MVSAQYLSKADAMLRAHAPARAQVPFLTSVVLFLTPRAPTETGPAPLAPLFPALLPFTAAGLVVGVSRVTSRRHALHGFAAHAPCFKTRLF